MIAFNISDMTELREVIAAENSSELFIDGIILENMSMISFCSGNFQIVITEKCCVLVKSRKRLAIVLKQENDHCQVRFVGNNIVDTYQLDDIEYWGPGLP